jgi:hypothetical protein
MAMGVLLSDNGRAFPATGRRRAHSLKRDAERLTNVANVAKTTLRQRVHNTSHVSVFAGKAPS